MAVNPLPIPNAFRQLVDAVCNDAVPTATHKDAAAIYAFGPYQLDVRERMLLHLGAAIPLRPKVFDTLLMLVRNAGRLVTKEALLRQVWPDTIVEENNLNGNISVLRKLLGGSATAQVYVETVPRIGYRFIAPVETRSERLQSSSGNADRSLAVLYFEILSGGQDDESFRDGITEDIITELAKISELRLFPRSAVFAFRDQPVSSDQIAKKLTATHVLEGSLRRVGPHVRITARLTEIRTGHTVWTERYDHRLGSVFAVQDAIAKDIGRALRSVFSAKSQARQKTVTMWPTLRSAEKLAPALI
jgi:adenylate cyclase